MLVRPETYGPYHVHYAREDTILDFKARVFYSKFVLRAVYPVVGLSFTYNFRKIFEVKEFSCQYYTLLSLVYLCCKPAVVLIKLYFLVDAIHFILDPESAEFRRISLHRFGKKI